MAVTPLECDYLVIGAGATGMAFVDELLYSTETITFIIVDKFNKPGGHWLKAYDYATLHQPAAFYGVKSRKLGRGNNDLATYNELRYYYEEVMHGFLKTGRVRFFPQCEYKGNKRFNSLLEPDLMYKVTIKKKIVHATYREAYRNIPSMKTPEYGIAQGVNLVSVNGLSDVTTPWAKYVIIGGGKTGIDAVLYLLHNSVNPERVVWIVPTEQWFMNRDLALVDNLATGLRHNVYKFLESATYQELVDKWEEAGYIVRIDPSVEARCFKAATVSSTELRQLRRITNILRYGRVERIENKKIVFNNGYEVPIDDNTLHVDCSAKGEIPWTPKPIWKGESITIQFTHNLQPQFSATCIAALEHKYENNEETKNKLLVPIHCSQTLQQFVRFIKQSSANEKAVTTELGSIWLRNNRLDLNSHIPDDDWQKIVERDQMLGGKVDEALDRIIATIDDAGS